jgi:hypothetical protein
MGYFDNDSLNKYKKILILIRIFLRYILNIKNINLIFIRCILILKQNKQKKSDQFGRCQYSGSLKAEIFLKLK